jgi:hypothetical protein
MNRRQLINNLKPSPTSFSTPSSTTGPYCTPFTLPSNGVLELGPSDILTLTSNAVFTPECTDAANVIITTAGNPTSTSDFRDPFYASTIPACYALAATTVIAYMLVIMLLITPRTFLHQGAVVLGRRGFTNGPSGSDAGIGIGGRPWLQKVAALTVAVSLTIATADTFRVTEKQYNSGFMNAMALQDQVDAGMELKIIRVVSDTFLWLAQAQTLIRLFPRQREKIIIKWTGFALITLDVLFSILNSFLYHGNSRPHTFVDAVPALAYLFQLALSLLYCAWVIYYGISKRRYAFYHPQMRNICLVALLSLVSVLVPVVFFVLDISKPKLATWGDYVRWVGAAAASVVVWEWVERIEALERNDKKDGVLGREVFDGDEMLEVTPSSEFGWTKRFRKDNDDKGAGTATGSNGISWPAMAGLASRSRPRATQDEEAGQNHASGTNRQSRRHILVSRPPLWPSRPPPAATPVNRSDTASAESTVYAVRYHPISDATPPVDGRNLPFSRSNSTARSITRSVNNDEVETDKSVVIEQTHDAPIPQTDGRNWDWNTFAKINPFRHRVYRPPQEISLHAVKPATTFSSHRSSRWDLRARLEDFAATQADRFRERTQPTLSAEPLPVTVIPAPTRRRAVVEPEAEAPETRSSPTRSPLPEGPFNIEIDTSGQDQHTRTSDPYTPNSLQGHSITHRGSISFATAVQPEIDQRVESSAISPTLVVSRDTPASSSLRSSPSQARSSVPPVQSSLPVIVIPAPPRRPRVEDT